MGTRLHCIHSHGVVCMTLLLCSSAVPEVQGPSHSSDAASDGGRVVSEEGVW